MADRTLTVNGQPFTFNRDRFAGVRNMTVNGETFTVDRTASVIDSDRKGESRPLLSKVVGGAAAAYSLRDLNDKQGNNKVVRVRRSSDNAERDFLAKEVSNGTLLSFVNTNINLTSGFVSTWYDQSGNGNDATQSVAGSQPKIVDGGSLVRDSSGNPALVGDGIDDELFNATLTQQIDNSDFLVTAAYENQLAMGIQGAVPRLYLTSSRMSYDTNGTITYDAQTGKKILSFQVVGATQEVFANGTSLGTASRAQANIGQSLFGVTRGGSSFSSEPLMEVIVYNSNQSANRPAIEANINNQYDIY